MPIYEYECLKCSTRFELRRSMADSDREAECPKCGAKSLPFGPTVFDVTSKYEVVEVEQEGG